MGAIVGDRQERSCTDATIYHKEVSRETFRSRQISSGLASAKRYQLENKLVELRAMLRGNPRRFSMRSSQCD
jgi:hypothetical protein